MSDDPFDAEIAAALEGLREEYLEVLPRKVADLERSVEAFRRVDRASGVGESGRGGREAAWDAARRRAHALRGTAGSYGFRAISDAAGLIEDAFEEVSATPPAESRRAFWVRVDAALEALVAAYPRATSEPDQAGSKRA